MKLHVDITKRKLEERQKFARLVKTVIWCKERTGKPYPEVLRILFYKRHADLPELMSLTPS